MDFDYIKLVVTVSLVVIGWLIANHFTARRDRINKRREISLEHLVDAYRVLTNEVTERKLNSKRTELLENILSDIQLFGSIEQVKLARSLATEIATVDSFDLDPLINSLRDDLRDQLQLDPVSGNVRWLRFTPKETNAESGKDECLARPPHTTTHTDP